MIQMGLKQHFWMGQALISAFESHLIQSPFHLNRARELPVHVPIKSPNLQVSFICVASALGLMPFQALETLSR